MELLIHRTRNVLIHWGFDSFFFTDIKPDQCINTKAANHTFIKYCVMPHLGVGGDTIWISPIFPKSQAATETDCWMWWWLSLFTTSEETYMELDFTSGQTKANKTDRRGSHYKLRKQQKVQSLTSVTKIMGENKLNKYGQPTPITSRRTNHRHGKGYM